MEGNSEVGAQVADKLFVSVGFIASQMEIAMGSNAVIPQLAQDMEQCHRVCATAKSHQDR